MRFANYFVTLGDFLVRTFNLVLAGLLLVHKTILIIGNFINFKIIPLIILTILTLKRLLLNLLMINRKSSEQSVSKPYRMKNRHSTRKYQEKDHLSSIQRLTMQQRLLNERLKNS